MIYRTATGYMLEVGRVDRRRLDRFVAENPAPEPPVRQVTAFGGVVEEVPVLDDPSYQLELYRYYVKAGHAEREILAEAITVDREDDAMRDLGDLHEIGLAPDITRAAMLEYVVLVNDDDMARVIDEIIYQSTVTERGIQEAAEAYGAMWGTHPVLAYKPKPSRGSYRPLFEHRRAAIASGYKWDEFCALSGAEQSEVVAYYRIDTYLTALQMDERR